MNPYDPRTMSLTVAIDDTATADIVRDSGHLYSVFGTRADKAIEMIGSYDWGPDGDGTVELDVTFTSLDAFEGTETFTYGVADGPTCIATWNIIGERTE